MYLIEIPIRLVSESNNHEHWTKKRKRKKCNDFLLQAYFNKANPILTLPCEITLCRIAPRELDDDNLRGAFKGIRDWVADRLIPGLQPGRADSDKRITWQYRQEKRNSKEYKVLIQIVF